MGEAAELAAVGATALLEAIREVDSEIRFYQASSSEIFGEPLETPQTEQTPLAPLTPYGVAKAYAHFITRSYRLRYGLHASAGILVHACGPHMMISPVHYTKPFGARIVQEPYCARARDEQLAPQFP